VRSPGRDDDQMTENRGAEHAVTLSWPQACKREHEKSARGKVQLVDTSLLMSNPFSPAESVRSIVSSLPRPVSRLAPDQNPNFPATSPIRRQRHQKMKKIATSLIPLLLGCNARSITPQP
jgi:hypothetical protein